MPPMVMMSPEFEILRICGSPERAGNPERIREQASRGVDWGRTTRMAWRHGLLPLLHRYLKDGVWEILPATDRELLERHARSNAFRMLAYVKELIDVLDGLEERGVRAVPYKGPVLAAQLYGDFTLRQSSDLDLVVGLEDVELARTVLEERGYRAPDRVSGARRSFMVRNRYSERFERKGAPVLELHWAFTNGDIGFPLVLDDLWPGVGEVRLGGRTVPTFSRDDLVFLLSVHGAKHRWDRLEWLGGLAHVLRGRNGEDWDPILERAVELGCQRMVALGALLASRYCEIRLPEGVRSRIEKDPMVPQLAQQASELLATDTLALPSALPEGSLQHDLFHLRLRERTSDQVRFLFYRFTTPSRPEEWRAMEVRGWTVPLHSLIRPFTVAFRLAPAVWFYVRDRLVRNGRPGGASGSETPGQDVGKGTPDEKPRDAAKFSGPPYHRADL